MTEETALKKDKKERTNTKRRKKISWTLMSALNQLLIKAHYSELSDKFWEESKEPLDFLTKELRLTKIQVLVLAILMELGEPSSPRDISKFLRCTYLSLMVYSEEIDELMKKRWTYKTSGRHLGKNVGCFALENGVVDALRHNRPFVPEKIDGLTTQDFVNKIEHRIERFNKNFHVSFCGEEEWLINLCKANTQVPLCHEVLKYRDNIHVQSLFLMVVFDYAQNAGTNDEGIAWEDIDDLYEEFELQGMLKMLKKNTHPLIKDGLIEQKCEDGIADINRYVLTKRCKEKLLNDYVPNPSGRQEDLHMTKGLKSHLNITEKTLFYNQEEKEQIEKLTDMLKEENLVDIQHRLEEEGLRKGIACLFYGTPGTGKTETVFQIARLTGRDILQINIAGLRDKYVGESEKNIEAVFNHYHKMCKQFDKLPILFFNEADGIMNKRTEHIDRAVEKMDNAMQNIILQEIENLDGILIATTNLTNNLDKAFERRFLFKVEFHQPETEVKAKIWKSMMKDLSEDEALTLAKKFNFSGGQIENIARKRSMDYILSGQKTSFDKIESYCINELISDNRQHITGFSR